MKTVTSVLLAALLLAACAPAATLPAPSKTQITVPTSTSSPVPATVTAILPTTIPSENPTPTPAPTIPLSAKGPWLLYLHNKPQPQVSFDVQGTPAEFIILNQDGIGRASITLPDCDGNAVDKFLLDGQNVTSYPAQYQINSYLFRPAQATGMRLYGYDLWFPACNTWSNGDEKDKLLASLYQAEDSEVPELMIYELPGGKIRSRIPLVKCAQEATACQENHKNWGNMGRQTPEWSPNGRYLAFAAVLDSASSDLFLYDAKDGKLRRLTNGPDWVGPIAWSPDGTQIIMNEIADQPGYFPDPSMTGSPSTSLWSVSVINNEIKLLYQTNSAHTSQTIGWVDDKHFFAYEGFLSAQDQAQNLRWVDTSTGTSKIIFADDFVMESLDPIHQTFALAAIYSEKYQDIYYLVSVKDGTPRALTMLGDFPAWDSETGLFVTSNPCENDPNGVRAVDYLGNFKCVTKTQPTPTATPAASRYPAPNEKWTISVKDGIWLEAQGQSAVQISPQTASEVIWCPDSTCFFFFAPQEKHKWNLYRVSIADLTVKMVDEGIESTGSAQWLGNDH